MKVKGFRTRKKDAFGFRTETGKMANLIVVGVDEDIVVWAPRTHLDADNKEKSWKNL